MATTLKQHYMIEIKEGGGHPIFSLSFLPENIASFVETIILSTEYLFVVFFVVNLFLDIYRGLAMTFVPTIIVNGLADDFFAIFRVPNNEINNLIALLTTILLYDLGYRYFEWVKYNLHPKEKNLS